MTCREIEDLILESMDGPADVSGRQALEAHLSECGACRQFQETQLALDVSLAACYAAPELRPEFDRALRRSLRAERRRVLWEYLPDLLHWGGGLAGSVVCAWILPYSAGLVLAAGVGFTLSAYVFQVVLRVLIEQAEGL